MTKLQRSHHQLHICIILVNNGKLARWPSWPLQNYAICFIVQLVVSIICTVEITSKSLRGYGVAGNVRNVKHVKIVANLEMKIGMYIEYLFIICTMLNIVNKNVTIWGLERVILLLLSR